MKRTTITPNPYWFFDLIVPDDFIPTQPELDRITKMSQMHGCRKVFVEPELGSPAGNPVFFFDVWRDNDPRTWSVKGRDRIR